MSGVAGCGDDDVVSKGVSRVLEAVAVDWKRREGVCGDVRCAQKTHGAVPRCTRSGEFEVSEARDARSPRTTVGRMDRMISCYVGLKVQGCCFPSS